jgi:hypothetical protein
MRLPLLQAGSWSSSLSDAVALLPFFGQPWWCEGRGEEWGDVCLVERAFILATFLWRLVSVVPPDPTAGPDHITASVLRSSL